MVTIGFAETSKQGFVRELHKGIAAPVMLFGGFEATPLLEIKQIPPAISDEQALNNDGKNIENDFKPPKT